MLKIIFLSILFSISKEQSKVFQFKRINSENMVTIFQKLNVTLGNKTGLKVHSGEKGGIYFLTPDFLDKIYQYTNGTYIECNAAYKNMRHTTELHEQLLKEHKWRDNNRRFVIMDADPEEDFFLPINNSTMISQNIVGGKLKDFDSCVVLAHLKGHSMGGFGGALKQLSIGFASQKGNFTAAMGDAASSIVEYFRNRSGIVFINVMSNISMECDCAGKDAPEPKILDLGILASTDPVALDKACIDIIRNTSGNGKIEWIKQLENLLGENTIRVAEAHGIGTQNYELIVLKDDNSKLLIIVVVATIVGVSLFVGIFLFLILRNKPRNKVQEDFHLTQKMNE